MNRVIERLSFILTLGIFLFGVSGLFVFINARQKDICINKGGKVIENGFGYFEKCIYGGDEK